VLAFLLVLGTNESEVAIVDSSVTPSVDRTIKVTELVDELIIVFTTDDLTTNDGSTSKGKSEAVIEAGQTI
jgi:hypothetical protein